MINGVHTLNVLVEVAEERHAQDERWGEQNHPVHDHSDPTGIYLLGRRYADFERLAKLAFSRGARSWALIELEELFEALAAPTPERAREEFVQVAAVAVAAVEALDRDEAKKHSPDCELGLWHGGKCGPSAEPVPATFRPEEFSPITKETVAATIQTLMGVPLADAVRKVAPDMELTEAQRRVLDSLPDATVELKLTPLPAHVTDPYDAVGGDMDALLKARTALGRAPVCGREAATAAPCSDHWPLPAVVSIRHAYNGAGRLHGICRCSEPRDHWSHQCPDCEHGFHTAPCRELVGSGAPGDVDECGCGHGYV